MEQTNTKEKLLNAASKLFRKQGYHATSLSQITKESNAPRGSIYYYFPEGKEQLAKEAIQRTGKKVKSYLEESLALEEDAALAIHNHIERAVRKITQQKIHFDTNISLAAMSTEVWSSNETLRQACEEVYEEWEQVYVDKLMRSGYEPEEAKRLGVAIQAWTEGAYVLSLSRKDVSPLLIVSEQILKLLTKND
ncbi:TetR/AcrR family transcriptional regulator [Bacillus pseudomycoides]|uniref:TetR/AcrR family transcriptional regulator n=1 Tax=Bacillus bingmayongensis TaxID=1150157 RepID=A0ABU5JXD4_9BACI|nr:TetR/AcrR family transcriptional regulator [Bacillus pseudomycoides]